MAEQEKAEQNTKWNVPVIVATITAVGAIVAASLGCVGAVTPAILTNLGNIFPGWHLESKASINAFLGNKVKSSETVSGKISSSIPDDNFFWLYVKSAGSNEFFFYPIVPLGDGSWTAEKVRFGPSLKDRGDPPNYTIGVALFNAADNEELIKKRDHLSALPSSANVLKKMEVIRK